MIDNKKKELRKLFLEKRSALSTEEKNKKDVKIFSFLLKTEDFSACDTLLAYYPTKNEIDTVRIIEYALKRGKKVALPRCKDKGRMNFYFISSLNDLSLGAYNIQEPDENCALFEGRGAVLCIVPALSYDKHGYRLGYGGGYYDRFLSNFKGKTIGLVYTDFLSEELPKDKYDIKVGKIITEGGVIE